MLRIGALRRLRAPSQARRQAVRSACMHTIQVQRATDYESALDGADQYAALDGRGVIKVSGRDAREFLQGMHCNDMPLIAHGAGMLTGFLSPQGRVVADAFVYAAPGEPAAFLVEVDARVRAHVQRLLAFYRLRAQVEIRDASSELGVWQVWGPQCRSVRLDGAWMADGRAPGMGRRVVAARVELPAGFDERPAAEYRMRRILKGVAEGADDFVAGALPLECNLDLMQGVHFGKGCYVGQELTIRTHHRGVVRRRMVPVVFSSQADGDGTRVPLRVSDAWAPEVGQRDVVPSAARARRPGRVGSTAGNAGLALMRLEHVEQFVAQADGKITFEAECADGQRVYVSPWVPSWWPSQ